MSNTIIKQYTTLRAFTLNLINRVNEEEANIVPDGYNNNIRWNIGHILVAQDFLLYGREHAAKLVTPGYAQLFSPGTKPAEWEGEVPTLATLATELQAQMTRIVQDLENRLDEKLPQQLKLGSAEMDTYGEVMIFTMYHEGWHSGYIHALRHAIGK